jgi:hypothetical protein
VFRNANANGLARNANQTEFKPVFSLVQPSAHIWLCGIAAALNVIVALMAYGATGLFGSLDRDLLRSEKDTLSVTATWLPDVYLNVNPVRASFMHNKTKQ